MQLLFLLLASIATTCAIEIVKIKKESIWRPGGGMKVMQASCTFTTASREPQSNWTMDINVNKPTTRITIWLMKVVSQADDGSSYKLTGKYPFGPQTMVVSFQLEFTGKAPKGVCVNNLSPKIPTLKVNPAKEESESATDTNATSAFGMGDSVPVTFVSSWDDEGSRLMEAQCLLPLDQVLDNFKLNITFDKPTESLEVWVGKVIDSDPNRQWYSVKNYWTQYPPLMTVLLFVRYYSEPSPVGECTLSNEGPSEKPATVDYSSSTMEQTTLPVQTTSSGATSNLMNPKGYDYSEVLEKSILFYEAQRSGELPTDNRIPYRGDSALGDKADDGSSLTGGWYNGHDGVKFNLPMASATTVLAWGLHIFKDAYQAAGQLMDMYDSIKWSLDYLLKCWQPNNNIFYAQVGNADLDHSFWGRHEEMKMSRPAYQVNVQKPGSDVAGETAASLAAGYIAFKDMDSDYANTLLTAAESLFEFADTHRGKYSDSIPQSAKYYKSGTGYIDELCYAAAMLFKATNKTTYLTKAEQFASTLSIAWAMSWDEKTVGCQALLYEATNKDVYKNAVKDFLNEYLPGGRVPRTQDGLAWRSESGALRYSANSAFIALVAAELGIRDVQTYIRFAESQLHYALGDNKNNRSYVVGFGKNSPVKPHHRASSCPDVPANCTWKQLIADSPNPHVLYGALVGGPNEDGFYEDVRSDYVMNGVAIDYNAGFQSAIAGLMHFKGQKVKQQHREK